MRKKLLCAVMCCVLICGTFAPKRAYAVAGVDDVAVVIVCALLAAAGVTFATNDGVQDAVQGFLEASAGKYDSTIERLASGYSVYGSVGAFKIPSMALGGVRLLLEGLFDYFETDENRQGSVVVSDGGFDIVLASDLPVASNGVYYTRLDFSSDKFITLYSSSGVPLASCDLSSAYVSDGFVYFKYNFFSDGVPGKLLSTYYAASGTVKGNFFSSTFDDFFVWLQVSPGSDVFSGSLSSYSFLSAYGSSVNSPWDSIASPFCVFNSIGAKSHYVSFGNTVYCSSSFSLPSDWVPYGGGISEKSIPYGLTFPQELTAPDVIDNFEQRVEEAAGDLAIVVPVDGVVDNTLPYAEAQEQYLTNVNELGEVTDTITESNTWLQKILTAVKALPATVIGTGSLDFSCFSDIGLSSVFPFCIPFDLKNALMGFYVTPAEPIWEISFDGTFMSAAGSFVLDMTKFEKLFAVVRFFIYGGFVVSLILLTRKIIKG